MKALKVTEIHKLQLDIWMQSERWQEKLPSAEAVIGHICTEIVSILGDKWRLPDGMEISVVLADDAFITTLNMTYRGKNTATNVLSFPALALKPGEATQIDAALEVTLGDVIIALETVEREAIDEHKAFSAHFTHMVVHGVLHLLGYDHMNDKDAEEMEALEIVILNALGVENPY